MLTFDRKFYFDNPADLAAVCKITSGASVYADGSFEAAADQDLEALLGGEPIKVSSKLVLRVTANSDDERNLWLGRILAAVKLADVDCAQQGYWGPTGDYEPSYEVRTHLDAPTPELLGLLYEYLSACGQYALYLEWGGRVVILDTEEVPAFAAELVAQPA